MCGVFILHLGRTITSSSADKDDINSRFSVLLVKLTSKYVNRSSTNLMFRLDGGLKTLFVTELACLMPLSIKKNSMLRLPLWLVCSSVFNYKHCRYPSKL